MTTKDLLRLLTPSGWIASGLALLVLGVALWLLLHGAGFRFDPFDHADRRADSAEATAAAATSNAAARSAEATGARETARRTEHAVDQARQADAIATRHSAAAEAAPDANLPLDPDRARRLRSADRELCDLRPAACPGPAPPRDAGDRS